MLRFRVKGAGSENFDVIVRKHGEYINASCTCPAGGRDRTCSHRIDLLLGVIDNLIDNESDDPSNLKPLLQGTELEFSVAEVSATEKNAKDAQKLLRKAKEYLGFVMSFDGTSRPDGISVTFSVDKS